MKIPKALPATGWDDQDPDFIYFANGFIACRALAAHIATQAGHPELAAQICKCWPIETLYSDPGETDWMPRESVPTLVHAMLEAVQKAVGAE